MILVLTLVLTMLPAMAVSALAVTINDDNVFLEQSGSGKCTLTSAVMMLRRRAIIDGNANWESITEDSISSAAWINGVGLNNNFTYANMTVGTANYSGMSTADKKAALLAMLDKHPEGIEIYDGSLPHAVLLTDYDADSDTFYCADPGTAAKRIKLTASCNAQNRDSQTYVIANITKIWYITNKSGGGPGLLTVTLNPNGGTCDTKRVYVSADGSIGTLPTPEYDGFRFLGWYDAPTGGNKLSSSTIITKDITVYAQWKDLTIRGDCGESLKWSLNEDAGVLRISGSGEMNNYHAADGLRAPWFEYASIITSVVIGSGVKTVGNYAFADLKNLKSVEINSELQLFGSGAFYGCTALSDIEGIESVKVIGSECFRGCSALSVIGIPTGCVSVGSYAFSGTAIKSVAVPSSVSNLGEGAFSSCKKLSYAQLPSGLTQIPAALFSGCTALAAFFVVDDGSYGASSFTVGSGAFSGCTALREIGIYSRAGSLCISKNAFSGCTGIKSVSLDCRSLVLEDNAFPSGAKIDYINISGDFGSVAENAFAGVTTTLVYPVNGTSWGSHRGESFGGTLTWESYDNHVHDYKTTVVAPTCSTRGYTVFECKSCSEKFESNYVRQLGHNFVNGVCTVCGVVNPFTDLDAQGKDINYTDAILWAAENGVTSGKTATTFDPDGICTRAQVVTFLWRLAGEPKPSGSVSGFADVKSGAYYTDAVLWAAEKGITSGIDSTHFAPDQTVTRAQFVVFLWRYLDRPVCGGYNPFTDISSSYFAFTAILWAYENGVTSGVSATSFQPTGAATRAQVVTFLYRMNNLIS